MNATSMTSIDIYAFIQEFKVNLPCKIVNIYQNKNIFNFKLRCKNSIKSLIIEPSVRIHFTQFENKWEATNIVMNLRRHLKNKTIISAEQIEFDRILKMNITGEYSLYVEVLKRGNLVLTKTNNIIFSTRYVEMRDRAIKPNLPYTPPPNPPKNPLSLEYNEFKEILKGNDKAIKSLIKLGLGKKYSKEILYRLNIPETQDPKSIPEDMILALYREMKKMIEKIEKMDYVPTVYLEGDEPVEYSPIHLEHLKELTKKTFTTFNEALDYYYSSKTRLSDEELLLEEAIKKIEKKISNQERLIKEYERKANNYRKIGFLIYEKLNDLTNILETIRTARKEKNMDWKTISKKIEEGKKLGIPETKYIKKINEKTGKIHVSLDEETELQLDISSDLMEIAEKYFEKAKKLERKREAALEQLERSKKELEELLHKREVIKKKEDIIVKSPQRKWYHKFRWFYTSNGHLVVAGRDAESNERLVKNYMEEKDIFLHAEIHGAPATILKEGKKVKDETDLLEAAVFAASYSSAWKEGYTAIDVFWCNPEDVSLSPPSGMYLAKGSFIIKRKNYLRNVPLKLAIGVKIQKIEEKVYSYELLSGPPSAIKKQVDHYVVLIPGNIKKSEVAKMIISKIKTSVKENPTYGKILESIKIDKIIEKIPGPSQILESE